MAENNVAPIEQPSEDELREELTRIKAGMFDLMTQREIFLAQWQKSMNAYQERLAALESALTPEGGR